MSEFTAFVERPEKVEAFKFVGPHQVEQVLDAFGVSYDNWTLDRQGAIYRLTFPYKKGKPQPQTIIYNGTINLDHRGVVLDPVYHDSAMATGRYGVSTPSWIVKRYIDTDHPEVTVLSDKEFRRKYQASIEAA